MRSSSRLALLSLILLASADRPAIAQCVVDSIDVSFDPLIGGTRVLYDGTRALVSRPDIQSLYIYERGGAGWVLQDVLQGDGTTAYSNFGRDVAIDGDTIVLGAAGDSTLAFASGSFYIYEKVAGSWVESAHFYPTNPQAWGWFGCRVDIDGERIAVASSCNPATVQGSVHVYHKVAGSWTLDATPTPAGLGFDWSYGQDLSLSGDHLLVGAWFHDQSGPRSGVAYLFERGPSTWVLQQTLQGSQTDSYDSFGRGVSLSGDLAAIGAPSESNTGPTQSGAVYLFERQGAGFVEVQRLEPLNPTEEPEYGMHVRLDADNLSVLGRSSRYLHLYRKGPVGHELAAALELPEPYQRSFRASFVDRTAMIAGNHSNTSVGSAVVFEYEILDEVRALCDCGDRAWCANRAGGCINSSGEGGRVLACGSTSVAADDLVLSAEELPQNQFGLLFMGAGSTRVPFGDGFLCVSSGGAGVFRFPVRSSGSAGKIAEGPGIVAYSMQQFGGPGVIDAGESWIFQGWFRDPAGPLCTDSNEAPLPRGFGLTNSIEVQFLP